MSEQQDTPADVAEYIKTVLDNLGDKNFIAGIKLFADLEKSFPNKDGSSVLLKAIAGDELSADEQNILLDVQRFIEFKEEAAKTFNEASDAQKDAVMAKIKMRRTIANITHGIWRRI